jgi:hypothetical protein
LEKAAGFDGIYPEVFKNSGRRSKEWMVSFVNDILSTSKLPKILKRANVISIHKPGKDGIEPANKPQAHDFTENPTHDRGTNTR